jgi:hypothetical protein
MRRGTAALALAVLDVAGCAGLIAWSMLPSGPNMFGDPVSTLIVVAAVVLFASIGALLIRRVPANLVGALLLAAATAQVVSIGLEGYWTAGIAADPPWPGAAVASALTDVWFIAPFVIALIGIPLVFPDGRLPSRRFRWVVWVTAAGIVMQARNGLALLIPGLAGLDTIVGVLTAVSVGAIVFGFGGAAVAIRVRFRRGDPVQRQQVKWLLAVAGLAVVAFPPAMILGSSNSLLDLAFWAVALLAYLALPVAIGIAVLRYRLYDIDRLVSRTIGYLIVTGAMAVLFVGAVLLLQEVLAPLTSGNTVAVAASTLVVAALFQPLLRRVQRIVDRRFNRARYHAERTVAAFAAQLRDEVDLESLRADVLGVVAQTVAPAAIGLWIRQPEVGP